MNSLSGSAVLNRRKGTNVDEATPVLEDSLQWATIANSKSADLGAIKTVSYDPETKTIFATHKKGHVLNWNWKSGQFDTFLDADKSADIVHAVLCVGNLLWVSCGKGKINIYDAETLKTVTKVVAHTAEVFCMIKISGTGVAKVLTGSIDFVVKIWDEDAMLVSHSAHHHGAIMCAIQIHLGRDSGSHPQIWTGSNDGTIFKWNDVNRDGKVNEEEGTVLKHSTSEAITCLEQVSDVFVWAGTERGKLIIWDTDSEESVCEIPAHKERISSICAMGNAAWSASADKTIMVWSAKSLPVRPKLLYKLDVEIGYVKTMLKINWALWVFHSKGLAIYSSASSLDGAFSLCSDLKENVNQLKKQIESLESQVKNGKSVEESLEYQVRTLSSRQEKSTSELADLQQKFKDAQSDLEEVRKEKESSTKQSRDDIEQKEEEMKEKELEVEAFKQQVEDLKRECKERQDHEAEQERKNAEAVKAAEAAEADIARLEGEAQSRSAEIAQMKESIDDLQSKLDKVDEENQGKDREIARLEKTLEEQLESGKGRDSEFDDLRSKYVAEGKERETEIANLQERLDSQSKEKAAEIAKLQSELEREGKEKEAEIANLQRQLDEDGKGKDAEIQRIQNKLEAEGKEKDAEIAEMQRRMNEYDKSLKRSENDNRKLQEQAANEKRDFESKLANAVKGTDDAEESVKGLQDRLKGKEEQIQKLQEQILQMNQKADAIEAELLKRNEALGARDAEIANLQESQTVLREDSSRALNEARSNLEKEKQDMENRLRSEMSKMDERVAEISKSKDKDIQDSEDKLKDARDNVSSLKQALAASKEDFARLQSEKEGLSDEVKNLRENHAKTLLLAGSKHQELLARSRKEMEEKSNEYENEIRAKESEIADLQKKNSDTCGEYEDRLKELEEAQSVAEKELEDAIHELEDEVRNKEVECENQKRDASNKEKEYQDKIEEYQDKIDSQERSHEEEVKNLQEKIEEHSGELEQNRRDYEEKLSKEHDDALKFKTLYEDSQGSARILEEELGKIQTDFDQAESRIKEYHEMVSALKEIHQEQTKVLVREHEEEVEKLNHAIGNLEKDMDLAKENFQEKLQQQQECFEQEKSSEEQRHKAEIEACERKLIEQKESFNAKTRDILEKYKAEIESLTRASKEVELRLLAHIQKIEGEKKKLELDLAQTKEELQRRIHSEKLLSSKLESLEIKNEELEGTVKKNAVEKERIFMELEDLRSLIESTRGANPLAYANMFHPDGIDVALYMRTLKQDIFSTISELTKEISSLKHEIDVNQKNIVSLQDQSNALEEALEKKRKKKRKWKMAYLRMSASQTEEMNGLQAQLQQTSEQLQNQQIMYKKSQSALRQAAHQLQHAKGLEGALDQAQEEYAHLLTKLSSVRQHAESEKKESQSIINELQSELNAKTKIFEEAMSEMNQEVNVLKQMKRKQEEQHNLYQTAIKLEEEARARSKKVQAEENQSPSYKERERYSGFVC